MKRIKKKKFYLGLLILYLVIFQMDNSKHVLEEICFYLRSSKTYTTVRYDINIIKTYGQPKEFIYLGEDKKTGNLKYIANINHIGIFEIDATKGITESDALRLSNIDVNDPYVINLMVRSSFFNGERQDITDYMYWTIDFMSLDDDRPIIFISFKDGKIKDPY